MLANPFHLEAHGRGPTSQSYPASLPGLLPEHSSNLQVYFSPWLPPAQEPNIRSGQTVPAKVVRSIGLGYTVVVPCSLGSCCRGKALFPPDEPAFDCAANVGGLPYPDVLGDRHHLLVIKQAAELFTF